MNSGKLSKRLESVAAFIPAGTVLADIGSDHAYLPVFCVKCGSVAEAVAGEVAEGPYHSAQKQVEKAGLAGKISVRKGDGLEILAPGEAGCITIAGMGGALIASILDRGKAKLNGKETLILQPNTGSHIVRGWLAENGWAITGEDILEEDGKIYEIIAAEYAGALVALTEAERLVGPVLIKNQNEAFRKKWRNEIKKWQSVLSHLEQAGASPEIEEKKGVYRHLIALVEEVLT
ncbi:MULTISPECIES: tRNA (adenine(22)-N(1))-methyltransferase [Heyndrickxia]|jgi:tRNA (adenine22-N1)-methyltransferase|uniref:Uncharacterized protein n=1 Tax=Heyndrickxia coagulans TaxID=1398 RepID=A0A150KFB0_HEYCO|nr:tRNA (adenine(22)-N(1))-methyltransferase TrmK [Heyndrickxia coagulans]AEH53781.1 protein of unknown function DUF633 [Heyndrickxia coagulans 2-6]AJH79876.1 hypothetical protein BF29_775 [Heyndrickxia coagulans DSM 1 = ATCC 7050]KYC69802.1 hypothetical protein B4099_2969 [Heyndrickxia coagulans]MBF8419252.1 tRNA (adenine-N(1))-methyltransferase [Heyndrickxia coagulans]MCR2846294.1 tRNA (adenine(22)-N(1))-methyltransferase TrmK [Heyndrickxia coagulans]